MDKIWIEMHEAAEKVLGAKVISDYVTCGEVSAAVLSKSGKIYTGVCIDTCSTLGICAERNAIAAAIAALISVALSGAFIFCLLSSLFYSTIVLSSPSFCHVIGPQTPSASRPCSVWNCLTLSVSTLPQMPSTSTL